MAGNDEGEGEGKEKDKAKTKRKKGTVEITEKRKVNLETEDEILDDCAYTGKALDVFEAVELNLKTHGEKQVRVTIEVTSEK